MLHEMPNPSQKEKNYRRIFFDDDFYLYVWYKSDKSTRIGFQLVLLNDIGEASESLRWSEENRASLNEIDSKRSGYPETPLSGGIRSNLSDEFLSKSQRSLEGVEAELRYWVQDVISQVSAARDA